MASEDDSSTDQVAEQETDSQQFAVSSVYKILGELDASDGAGVLGKNTASSGTPVGVEGAVPNATDSGYGLATPHDLRLGGRIDTSGSEFVVEAELGEDEPAQNVVMGHSENDVIGAVAATISGGGKASEFGDGDKNVVTADEATISGGVDNEANGIQSTVGGGASNFADGEHSTITGGTLNQTPGEGATIGGGENNWAPGSDSTVAGGKGNDATADKTFIGGGFDNEASTVGATVAGGEQNVSGGEDAAIGGGYQNTVNGKRGTVGGGDNNTVDAPRATVPGGSNNTASGAYSFAAGRMAESTNQGSFVWADSQQQTFSSNGPDQFIVQADGGIGFGTNTPFAKVHVTNAAAGDAFDDPSKHVTIIENTADDTDGVDETKANTLAIRGGPSGDPGTGVNFISFYNGAGDSYGAIQGNGNGGTELKSTGSDYAEYLPRADTDASFEAGDVVGVREGELVADAADADRAMVISDQHIVLGNDPGADDSDHETVAFTGQVPVRVRGPVEAGDLIVPSGDADGTAVAISPAEWVPGDGPVVGQAWGDDTSERTSEVTVAVGIDDPTLLDEQLAAQRERIDELEAENESLKEELAAKEERIDALADRLAAVESQVGTAAPPADD